MSSLPNHFERQFMQQLRGRGWVNATKLPPGRSLIQSLLQKNWIESEGSGKSLASDGRRADGKEGSHSHY
jgi:ribosomal protein S19E (S16A)